MLFSIACSSLKVTSDFNKDTDFTKYNTFKVLYFVNDKDYEEKILNLYKELNKPIIIEKVKPIFAAIEKTKKESMVTF